MSKRDVFIVSATRTAVGSFNGTLSTVPATKLGSITIKAAVEKAGIKGEIVDEAHMGCVLTGSIGQAPARQAVLGAGLPISVPCTTIGKVCGSGLQSVIMTGRGIMLGDTDIAVAGGMENMTLTAYSLPKGRTGYRMGHGKIVDMMVNDGLWDVYNDIHMGSCADRCASQNKVSRQEQDDYAAVSYKRALKSLEEGTNKWEITPVEVPQRKKDPIIFAEDEGPKQFNEEKMRKLRPAFEKEGTITAGNASSINDGAGAVILASGEAVKKYNLTPLARIVAWGQGAREPEQFPLAPVIAVNNALKAAGMAAKDINYWEINEAFAVVPVLAMREFNLDLDIVNPLGGAISIGHPIGASGTRILVTLLNVLNLKKGKYGLATLCIGGGEGNAVIVERV